MLINQRTIAFKSPNLTLLGCLHISLTQLQYLLCLILFSLSSTLFAEPLSLSATEQAWLNNHPTIRFAGDPNWLPYEAFDKQGTYIGIVDDYLKIIEQKLGVTIERIPTESWTESVNLTKQGDVDILSESPDSDLGTQLSFTQSYIASPVVIIMHSEMGYVDNISQIASHKIALIKDYGYVPTILKAYPNIKFDVVDSIQAGLFAVSTGEIDALFATLAQASYHISENGINNIRIVGKTEFQTKLAFGMQQEFAPLIPLFNRVLSSISPSEKQYISEQWGKDKFANKFDYRLIAKIIAVFLFILAAIIYWNRKLAKEINRRKELEAQTQMLIDTIPLQIVVTSLNGRILTVNPQTLNDYNIDPDDVSDLTIDAFYADINKRNDILDELKEKGKIKQKITEFTKSDGSIHSMMLSVIPIRYQQQRALLSIAVDMTERIEMEAALHAAKQAAEKADHAKSEFLANMSHEIRTPMNAILGFTALLDEQVDTPKLKSFIHTIQSAGNNLLLLINDILDLSKIEAGKLEITTHPCNLHDLLSEVSEIFALEIRKKDLAFTLKIDSSIPPELILDAARLRQILLNLLGNAVKFTDHGFIHLSAYATNQINTQLDLFIEIKDSGIGVSKEQQRSIFDAFEQSRGQDVQKYGGTGLGLSISKRLLSMMDGSIHLTSKLKVGSTFTVQLNNINISTLPNQSEDRSSRPSPFIFMPSTLLIVDDVEDNLNLLLANFADTALNIVTAKNGLEAVNLAKKQNFDLILMDLRMPVMDGYQAAKKIKIFSQAPIIALSTPTFLDKADDYNTHLFDHYLSKPISKMALHNTLRQFLPFTETLDAPLSPHVIALTAEEQTHIPFVLDKLKMLMPQCDTLSKNNSISDIQTFTDTLMKISKQYPITPLSEYVTQLSNALNNFDIAEIKRELNYFPKLIDELNNNLK